MAYSVMNIIISTAKERNTRALFVWLQFFFVFHSTDRKIELDIVSFLMSAATLSLGMQQ